MSDSQIQQQDGFIFVETADGSPTVEMASENVSERMHHSGGAFSESLYIYHEAMTRTLETSLAPTFLSVGLGLGYNELILASEWLSSERHLDITDFYMESYESDSTLRKAFLAWLNETPPSESYRGFYRAYDQIVQRCAERFAVQEGAIKTFLENQRRQERWVLLGAFGPHLDFAQPFSCILYDAFSSKMSPELWDEGSLKLILQKAAGPSCVFATYAATGALKRALKSHQFVVEPKAGFSGKRQSTLAWRPQKNIAD